MEFFLFITLLNILKDVPRFVFVKLFAAMFELGWSQTCGWKHDVNTISTRDTAMADL
jgi:hypothetical protein